VLRQFSIENPSAAAVNESPVTHSATCASSHRLQSEQLAADTTKVEPVAENVILGRTLKHGETGSTKLLRLAKKSAGQFSRSVHETWNIKGRVGELKTPLLHLKENFISRFINRIGHYGPIDSLSLTKEGKPFSWFRLFVYPPAKFIHNYVVRRGVQDGLLGLFHAYLMSVQSLSVRIFQKNAKL